MGHPGVLPVANATAVERAARLALALHFTLSESSKFDRKHYFYPDLPKGYQISQYDEPLATDGFLIITHGRKRKRVRFERLHIEEDAAKLTHVPSLNASLVDFNRAGVPLVEIVTKPDITHPEEARLFLRELRSIVRLLGISDGDMEKGHLRCDANISLRPDTETLRHLQSLPEFSNEERALWPKTEIKSINSFKAVEDALSYEVLRQQRLWEQGQPPLTESTRGWDETKKETIEQRTKESLADYRYLPEPDLPRIHVSSELVEEMRAELPELPGERRERFDEQYHLDPIIRDVLVDSHEAADFFEKTASELKAWKLTRSGKADGPHNEHFVPLYEAAASWIVTKLFEILDAKKSDFKKMKLTAENFSELVLMLKSGEVTSTTAAYVLADMVAHGTDPHEVVASKNLTQLTDEDELIAIAQEIINTHNQQVMAYKAGKTPLIQFFVGQVMKKTKGRASPEMTKKILETLLR
jgi:aspartyl-tRNA(Asn)/glutamyl-tRNA(Gln) amidotransferase subunit B